MIYSRASLGESSQAKSAAENSLPISGARPRATDSELSLLPARLLDEATGRRYRRGSSSRPLFALLVRVDQNGAHPRCRRKCLGDEPGGQSKQAERASRLKNFPGGE